MEAGEQLGKLLKPGAVVSLDGPLGAGKTTFAKGLARGLGISETVTSPSYTILSVYEGPVTLYHFDLYRICNPEELEMIGFMEILYGEGISLIEWSDRSDELPSDCIRVAISILENNSRVINITGIGEL